MQTGMSSSLHSWCSLRDSHIQSFICRSGLRTLPAAKLGALKLQAYNIVMSKPGSLEMSCFLLGWSMLFFKLVRRRFV
jgi:hypothetical protein